MSKGVSDFRYAKKEIEHLQQVGFPSLEIPPQKHLCFSDYDFCINRKFSSYRVSGFELALKNKYFKTVSLPVGSSIFLDEAQRYYDSRFSFFLREQVYRWYQLHRHNKYNVYLTAQRLSNIDVNIRAIADKYIVIDNLDVKTDELGRVVRIKWLTRQFTSCEAAESYQMAKERSEISKLGVVEEISTDVDIFRFYDSYSNKFVFYDTSYSQDGILYYDYFTEKGYAFTLEGIVKFNNENYFCFPKGYLKKQRLEEV